ncbi:type II secretion system protein GspM [Agarivorans gilvus]|uniref:MSHA biogenesis protein MshJ n=1 Tax=Agarivorans gilvus TaxID=680279 RepID=A0ABQ1HXB6_9ALTE|nr:type II secretion system protein GspM [Agarivorans gilvus]GGA96092.1 MSHA biogenesis protein MshJ [Agarivorans gilvus]
MTEHWHRWQAIYAELSLRERVLILLTGVVLIVLPSYYFMLEPSMQQQQQAERELAQAKISLAETEQLIELSKLKLRQDPNQTIAIKLSQLQSNLSQLDSELAAQNAGLISVEQMAGVLERLLEKSDGLQLLAMESLAPQAVLSVEEQGTESLNFYRHGIRLSLSGGYFSLLDYLQKVEALPQRFLWKLMDYQVLEYPATEITIEIYTLSSNKDFISG